MERAEATRWRRPRPLGLGRGGTGARPLRVGRSSCGRCSIRRRPAPVLRSGSPVSWGRYHAPTPRPLNPSPLGSVAQGSPSPLFQCSTLFQKCSSALEQGFTSVPIGRTSSFFPLFQINRNRYRERRGGNAAAALLVLGVYVSGGRNTPPFLPQLAAPPQLAMFQRLRNRRRNTASAIRRGRVHRRSEPHAGSRPRCESSSN